MSILKIPKLQFNKSKLARSLLLTMCSLAMSVTTVATAEPIVAHADSFVTADGTEWVTAPSDLPWAGSADRQGMLFYVAQLYGGYSGQYSAVTPFTLAASNDEGWTAYAGPVKSRIAGIVNSRVFLDSSFHYPATYSSDEGTWTSTGGDTKSYLEEEMADGRQRWEQVVIRYWGADLVDKIKKDRGENYRICLESTSAFKRYRNHNGSDYIDNDKIFYGTVFDIGYSFNDPFLDIRLRTSSGGKDGTANQKWIQSIANGMVFSDEEEAKLLGCLHAGVVKSGSSPSGGDLKSKGYGFATIKPTLTPIHTYNGTTPGDPEEPIPDVTDGECSIYKLYYTQKYDKKGNLLEEKVDGGVHSRHNTTNYIVIDSEKGYVVEKWFVLLGIYFISFYQ